VLGVRPPISQASEAEGRLLRDAAKGARCAVEVGVAEGGSARYIREGMDPSGTLYLIDPYPPGRLGFGINMQRLLARRVLRQSSGPLEWVRERSDQAIAWWTRSIDFLHFDAEMEFELLRRDWRDWSPHVRPGGKVTFRGAYEGDGSWALPDFGPVRVVNELIDPDPQWVRIDYAHAAVTVQRIEAT
jgi:hypothetical protein